MDLSYDDEQYDFSWDELSKSELIKYVTKFKSEASDNSDQLVILKEFFKILTGHELSHFVQIQKEGEIEYIQEHINNFINKNTNTADLTIMKQLLNQLKEQLVKANNKIMDLQKEINTVEQPLKSKIIELQKNLDKISSEYISFKNSDPYERKLQFFKFLENKRKPLHMINFNDQETLNNESELLEKNFEILKEKIEDLLSLENNLNFEIINSKLSNTLIELQECRTKISYYLKDDDCILFLKNHISKLEELFIILSSKLKNETISMKLSAYESGILSLRTNFEDYLKYYMKRIDLEKRLLSYNSKGELTIFKNELPQIPYFLNFCNIEDIIKKVFITSNPINNIVYIPVKNSIGPDYFSFYTLELLEEQKNYDSDNENYEDNEEIEEDKENSIKNISKKFTKRHWKLDSHLLNTSRLFIDKFNIISNNLFRKFYKDVFGHNNYVSNFEKIIETRQIEHWKQMKILWENIQIVNDEYLIGEIIRKIIKQNATHYPTDVDIIKEDRDRLTLIDEFKRLRNRWNNKQPAFDEEPEAYIYNCFDKANAWTYEETNSRWKNRWKVFLS